MGGCSSKGASADALAHEQNGPKTEGGRALPDGRADHTLPPTEAQPNELEQPPAAIAIPEPSVEEVAQAPAPADVGSSQSILPNETSPSAVVADAAAIETPHAASYDGDTGGSVAYTEETTESAQPATPAVSDSKEALVATDDDIASVNASTPAELTALMLNCKLSVVSFSTFLRALLDAMKKAVDEAVAKDPTLAPSAEMGSELRLIRFLGANNWDAAGASAEYIKALALRKKHNLDSLKEKIISSNPDFFGKKAEELQCIFMHEKSREVNGVSPRMFTDLRNDGPHRLLRDRRGNLVVIECPGVVDYAAIANVGMSAWELEFLTFNELRVLVLDELSRRTGKLLLTCTVMDMSHASLMPNPFAPRVEKEGKKAASAVSDVAKAVYPTTTFRTYMINLSETTAKMAGPAVKAFVPARSAAKLKIFGQDFKPALLEGVHPSNLPERLGGELPNGEQWVWIDKKSKKK